MESSRRDLLNYMAELRSVLKNNQNTHFSLIFQDSDQCSAISMESSRRDLLNYMAEHRSVLENKQNTLHPRFIFTPKTSKNSLKHVFSAIVSFSASRVVGVKSSVDSTDQGTRYLKIDLI